MEWLRKFNQKKINSGIYENVLNSTNLKQFINSLPKKDLTLLGNLKDDLSGGQIQKINLGGESRDYLVIQYLDGKEFRIDNESGNIIPPDFRKTISGFGMQRDNFTGDLIIIFDIIFGIFIAKFKLWMIYR